MTTSDLATKVAELLEPEVQAHGLELVAVEQAGGRGTPVIRVLLDREGGIDIEALGSANRWISELLDATDPVSVPYTLEVSSPGVDRPLVKRADYVRFSGQQVSMKVLSGDKRKSWSGVLMGLEDDDVILDVDGQRVTVPFETIQKARLKGVVDFGKGREQSS